ncbi:DUF4167 domain-containing protein [Bartonella sp. LJL80]
MRPQQNRRMRGRNNNNNNNNNSNNNNNNNRRGPNPLSRNYESNGPDVKIRGNAQHVADKYTALARDAQAAGDRVMAENYLQHAEHYVRIILAAQAQMPQPVQRDEALDDDSEENNNSDNAEMHTQQEPAGSGPQPDIEGVPAEVALSENAAAPEQVEEPKKMRRTPRRRTPPTQSVEGEEKPATQVEETPAVAAVDDSVEQAVEAKPRRRRTVKPKVEKAAEEA